MTNNFYPTTGYTPPETHKLCIRCGQLNDNPFTILCDDCHLDDEYHTSETRKLENDHFAEVTYARTGGAQ